MFTKPIKNKATWGITLIQIHTCVSKFDCFAKYLRKCTIIDVFHIMKPFKDEVKNSPLLLLGQMIQAAPVKSKNRNHTSFLHIGTNFHK